MRTTSPVTVTSSIGTTASAPSGTTPPVAIAIASPGPSGPSAGTPAATAPTIGSSPGVSVARSAKPSIAELGKRGRSIVARASSARTRPAALERTVSPSSGLTRSRTSASASSTVRRPATALTVHTGYARRVISIVVPMRDEERTVEPLYDELARVLDGRDEPWEAIFVDDGSRDGTPAALVRLHEETANVKVVRLRRNVGKAAALDAGFREVEGETVVTIDGDLQDDPAEIPRLLAALDEGYDLVTGWKTHRSDPVARRVSRASSTRSRAGSRAFACTT